MFRLLGIELGNLRGRNEKDVNSFSTGIFGCIVGLILIIGHKYFGTKAANLGRRFNERHFQIFFIIAGTWALIIGALVFRVFLDMNERGALIAAILSCLHPRQPSSLIPFYIKSVIVPEGSVSGMFYLRDR